MVEEAVEEVLELVRKAAREFRTDNDEFEFMMEGEMSSKSSLFSRLLVYVLSSLAPHPILPTEPANTGPVNPSPASLQQQQQQDWSVVWQCFDEPHTLLAINGGLPKGMQVGIATV